MSDICDPLFITEFVSDDQILQYYYLTNHVMQSLLLRRQLQMILLSQSMIKDDVKVLIATILTVCSNKLNVDDSMTVVDDSMELVPLILMVLLIVNGMIDCNLYSTLSGMLE